MGSKLTLNCSFIIYDKVDKYTDDVKLELNENVDEYLMNDIQNSLQKQKEKVTSADPAENYNNYQLGNKNTPKLIKSVLKTRMKRYNDPDEVQGNEIFDVK